MNAGGHGSSWEQFALCNTAYLIAEFFEITNCDLKEQWILQWTFDEVVTNCD